MAHLDSEVKSLMRFLGCDAAAAAAIPPLSHARTPSLASVTAQLRRTAAGGAQVDMLNLSLTRAACEATKALYAQDTRLHREHCGRSASWD